MLALAAPVAAAPTGALAQTTPNDPGFALQYGLDNRGQVIDGVTGTPDADVDAPEAWALSTGSAGVRVAVVDDGIDPFEPDLAPNLVAGYDFGNGDGDPSQSDSDHGTRVAAVLGARGNDGAGMSGVSWAVSLMALKVRADGSGDRMSRITTDAVAAAFRYAGASGARVVNASFGAAGRRSETVLAALDASPDTLFVISAGNEGRDNDALPRYPCSYEVANLICVAASDANDNLADFSNYGTSSVDLAAPGHRVYTVVGRGAHGFDSGTSYAAPHVAGVAALYFARYPGATVADVRAAILGGVDRKPAFAGRTVTGGRLNAARTLSIPPAPGLAPALPGPPPLAPPPPPASPPPQTRALPVPTAGPARRAAPRGRAAVAVRRRQALGNVLRRGVRFAVTAPTAARVEVVLRLGARDARRFGLRGVVGRRAILVRATGTRARTVTVRLRRSAARRLAKQRRVTLRASVRVTGRAGVATVVRTVVLTRT